MAKGGSLGTLRDLSHPPIAVQSLHSSIISVFVESYSHSLRRRFSSGSENHARSRLRHPHSAPESRTLPVTRKYRPQRCPFRFRVPAAIGILFFQKSFLRRLGGGEEGRVGEATKRVTQKESRFSRGFLVNLATAARESTSSRDALLPPLISPGPRSPGAPNPCRGGGGGWALRRREP